MESADRKMKDSGRESRSVRDEHSTGWGEGQDRWCLTTTSEQQKGPFKTEYAKINRVLRHKRASAGRGTASVSLTDSDWSPSDRRGRWGQKRQPRKEQLISVGQNPKVQRRRVNTKRNKHKKTMLRQIINKLLNTSDKEKNFETSWRKKKKRGTKKIKMAAESSQVSVSVSRPCGKDILRETQTGVPQEGRRRHV